MTQPVDILTALAALSGRYRQHVTRTPTRPGHPHRWSCTLVPDDGRLDMGWSIARGDEVFGEGSTPEEAIRQALEQVPPAKE